MAPSCVEVNHKQATQETPRLTHAIHKHHKGTDWQLPLRKLPLQPNLDVPSHLATNKHLKCRPQTASMRHIRPHASHQQASTRFCSQQMEKRDRQTRKARQLWGHLGIRTVVHCRPVSPGPLLHFLMLPILLNDKFQLKISCCPLRMLRVTCGPLCDIQNFRQCVPLHGDPRRGST